VTAGPVLLTRGSVRPAARAAGPGTVLAAAFLLLVLAAACWPGLLASNPDAIDPLAVLQGPGAAHWLGTDQLGRDTFARIVYGTRQSLLIGVGSAAAGGAAGALWGLAAGLGGTVADEAAMRLADIFLSFPSLLMALLVVAILGAGKGNALIAIAVSLAPVFARVVRVQTLVVKDSLYVQSAVSLGLPWRTVVARHIVPNVLGPLTALLTMSIGTSVLTGSSLSFLGLGAQPPTPEWGAMLSESLNYIQADWELAVFPGVALALTVIAINVVGRDLAARFERRTPS
jgi:peptide/nickel transport system permease protein